MDFLSLCLIAKDEDEYLQEWIDYHILIGVDRFYIYDNESQNPIRELLKEYINQGWLIVHEIQGTAVQVNAYQHCLETYGKNTQWMGFVDADEFIVLNDDIDIKKLLNGYKDFGGLAISSVFFGPGNHKNHPIGGQIINYQYRPPLTVEDNQFVKCIVQPEKVAFANSPHTFYFSYPNFCVNSQGHRVDEQKFPVCFEKIQINHYFTRSEEDIKKKLNRLGGAGRKLKESNFDRIKNPEQSNDQSLFFFLERVLGKDTNTNIFEFKQNSNQFLGFIHQIAAKKIPVGVLKKLDKNLINAETYDYAYIKLLREIYQNIQNKRFSEARHQILIFLKSYPDYTNNSALYSGYATVSILQENFHEARDALNISFKKFGMVFENLRVLADFYTATHQFNIAEQTYVEVLQIGENADLLFRLIYVLLRQKNYPQIESHFENLLKNYSDNHLFQQDLYKNILMEYSSVLEKLNKFSKSKQIKKLLKPSS